jgi:hypothetical protein
VRPRFSIRAGLYRPRPFFAPELFAGDLRPDFDAALPDAFAEDFGFEDFGFEDFTLFFVEVFFVADFLPADLAADFAEALRDAPRRFGAVVFAARAAVETAFSIAVFALEVPSVAGPGRIKSPAVGLTAPTADAAVSNAALASPAACSPACPISLEAVSTAPPKTPRATSSAPPPLFFFAIFNSLSVQLSAFSFQPDPFAPFASTLRPLRLSETI